MSDAADRPSDLPPSDVLPPADAGSGVPEDVIEVDARGKACPMPVIELSQAVEAHPVGVRFRLLATDPAAKVDVPVWCRMQRQELRAASEDGGVWTFVVDKIV